MLREIEEVLHNYNWWQSSNMMPRLSFVRPSDNIYFIPTTNIGGIFVEWKGKGHKTIVVCEYSFGRDCLLNILNYSGKSYQDWINLLIHRNERKIQLLINENKELIKQLEDESKID
jgi:hypothetical protein